MKSFFKKIGKAIKSGFKKLGKFFNSKIGKILGTVLMAWSLGGFFKSMFKGGAKAAAEGAAAKAGEGAATSVAGEATEEVAKKALEESSKEVIKNSTLDSTGKILIENADDVVNLSNNVVAEGSKQGVVFDSIAASQSGLEKTLSNATTLGEELTKTGLEKGFSAEVSQDTLLNVISDTTTKQEQFNLGKLAEAAPDLPTESVTGQPFTQQQKNLMVAMENASPKTIRRAMANPDFRTAYEAGGYENLSSRFKSPDAYGAREFSSYGEAIKAGDNLLSKAGNIMQHTMETSVGELTGGKVGGFLGDRGAAGTAFTGIRTAASLLAEPMEMPRPPNYAARSVSQGLLSTGEDIAMTPTPPGVADMYATVDFTSPNALQQMYNIHNGTYYYGGGGMNFGRASLA
jgi:hypothetical protein